MQNNHIRKFRIDKGESSINRKSERFLWRNSWNGGRIQLRRKQKRKCL